MSYQKITFVLAIALGFFSCNNDDDGISIEQQNAIDDAAIETYLTEHYFGESGKIESFDEDDDADDNFPTLMSLATKDPSGFWVIKNPEVETLGEQLTSNQSDSLLLSYTLEYFIAEDDDTPYNAPIVYAGTINSTGLPRWDPSFYYSGLTDEQITPQNKPEFYEIEGIVEGLKQFTTTNRNPDDLFYFQGAIVVPSRLAFARDINLVGVPSSTSFIFNFEAVKRLNRQ